MIDVSVIIVSMDRPDLLGPCLDGLYGQTCVPMEVLVVAYRYAPENLAAVRSRYPSVRFIEQNNLAGFSENNNLALREARGRYCLIVNDDTLIRMPLIDRLVADYSSLPASAAAISPKIIFPDGRVQTCGRAPWTACRYLRHYLHMVDETKPSKWSMKEGLFQTWTLNGACFLIRTDVFREAGWFDERFVFTPEDIALGQKLNEMGYTVWTDADVEITHLAGGTVGSGRRLSPMETVIKPVRVRGALVYYSRGSSLRYFLMGVFIWIVELLRGLKYLFTRPRCRSAAPAPSGTRAPATLPDVRTIRLRTARTIRRHAIFTRRSAKELFLRLYGEL